MSHLLGKNDGLYNPSLRFAFTNITEEDFVSYWDKIPIKVAPGETIEISNTTPIIGAGHAIANKMTDELVDKIMINGLKTDEELYYKNNPNTAPNVYRARSSLGVPSARKFYEDKIVRVLDVDEESPAIQAERKRIMAEIQGQMQAEKSTQPPPVPTAVEFADIDNVIEQEPKPVKKPAKVKAIKLPKAE